MARYDQFVYSTTAPPGETYGTRIRGDIPLNLVPLGYSVEPQTQRIVAKFQIEVGPLPKFPDGTEVVVAMGSSYYPPTPDRSGLDTQALFHRQTPSYGDSGPLGQDIIGTYVYATEEVFNSGPGEYHAISVLPVQEGWRTLYMSFNVPPVAINSVVYLRAFCREPVRSLVDGTTLRMPWDVRGESSFVIPGNYGGIFSAVQSVPPTFYTGGDPYASLPHDRILVGESDNDTVNVVSSLGSTSSRPTAH